MDTGASIEAFIFCIGPIAVKASAGKGRQQDLSKVVVQSNHDNLLIISTAAQQITFMADRVKYSFWGPTMLLRAGFKWHDRAHKCTILCVPVGFNVTILHATGKVTVDESAGPLKIDTGVLPSPRMWFKKIERVG